MKKFLIFAAVATTLLASCSKIENDPVAYQSGINFIVATHMISTKGVTAFPTTSDFASYAYYADRAAGQPIGTPMYEEDRVSYNTAEKYWITTVKHYWPKSGTLTFLAYAPYTVSDASLTPAVTTDKMVWTDAKVYAENADILYADKAIGMSNSDKTDAAQTGHDKGVPTVFNHATSQVQIVVTPAYLTDGEHTTWEVKLNSFKLEGINTLGTCTVASNDLNTQWGAPVWVSTNPATVVDYTIPTVLNSTSASVSVLPTHIMVPQTISDDAKITVNVDIITKIDGAVANTVADYTYTAQLNKARRTVNNALVEAWVPGYSYIYTIRLTPADSRDENGNPTDQLTDALIKFDPVSNDWTQVECSLAL